VLLRHNPDVPVHTLPVSWRLPVSAAPVVSEAFYPFTGFRAATGPTQRRVAFSAAPFGKNAVDLTLDTAAAHGWALYELPARHTVRTDAEAVAACAVVAARVMQRGAIFYSERSVAGAPVTADRIAVGTAHRDQAQAIRAILAAGGLPGITELLDAHPSTEPVHLNVPVKFPDGWAANQALLAHLSQFKVRAS
jgi:hypothetical protein